MYLHFQIRSSTHYLSFLRGLLASLNLPRAAANKCASALVEAVNNAIFHAHEKDEKMPIDITINVGGGRVAISVKDCGSGFNIETVKPPSIDALRGRGLFIIKSLMSRVDYKNNTLRMVYEQ